MRLISILMLVQLFCSTTCFADQTLNISGWIVSISDDDFSDTQKVVVAKLIDFNKAVAFRCIGKSLDISIFPGFNIKSGDEFPAQTRIDRGEIMPITFESVGEDSKVMLIASDIPDGFFQKISNGKKISFRITGSTGDFDVSYPITGIDKALPYLKKACPDAK